MRFLPLLSILVLGCATAEDSQENLIDVSGDWTADFLINTTNATPGDEKNNLGDLTLGETTGGLSAGADFVEGTALFKAVAYAPQGSLQTPTLDDQGETLYEPVGFIVYRGGWTANAYEGTTSFTYSGHCEEIQLTSSRPDLQAVICGDPFDFDVYDSCSRPEGGKKIICTDSTPDRVWSRK